MDHETIKIKQETRRLRLTHELDTRGKAEKRAREHERERHDGLGNGYICIHVSIKLGYTPNGFVPSSWGFKHECLWAMPCFWSPPQVVLTFRRGD